MSLMSSQSAFTARSGSSKPFTGQPIKPTRAIVAARSRSHVVKASAQVSRLVGWRVYLLRCDFIPFINSSDTSCMLWMRSMQFFCRTTSAGSVSQLCGMWLSYSPALCSITHDPCFVLYADPFVPRRMRPRFAAATVHSFYRILLSGCFRFWQHRIVTPVPRDRPGELYTSGSDCVFVHAGP